MHGVVRARRVRSGAAARGSRSSGAVSRGSGGQQRQRAEGTAASATDRTVVHDRKRGVASTKVDSSKRRAATLTKTIGTDQSICRSAVSAVGSWWREGRGKRVGTEQS
jgi:hypothetical protein